MSGALAQPHVRPTVNAADPAVAGTGDLRRTLPPGWPLALLFLGYPIWWALGVSAFIPMVLAVPMVQELARHRRIKAPQGFGIWLLFLLWVIAGVFVLQVNAPDAIPGIRGSRYITFAYRLAWYVAATVVLLYIGNMRKSLSKERIARLGGWMFLIVVAGGLLGTFLPHLQFPSLVELVLPHSLTQGAFVNSLVHPSAAQVQSFLGYDQGRASAPFSYTNEWALNYGVFLPFFVVSWFKDTTARRRLCGTIALFVSLVPVVASLNRGLWLSLVTAALFVAIRSALMGRTSMLAGILLAAALAGLVIVFTPLGSLVQERLVNGNSNSGRTHLGTQTFLSTAEGSPVIGFGTTRDPLGNWTSIAAGATAQCPRCSPPPLGTQGQLWLLLFTQGFGGLLLYFGFLAFQFVRHLMVGSGYALAGLTVLVIAAVTSPFYTSVDLALVGIMMAVGLMWRARRDEVEGRLPTERRVPA